MVRRLVPKVALTTVAAVGLYVPTLGLPLPASCMRTGATASAAPSPSCSSDLRECLRSSARETIYGARYVTAEDVARCVETFNACINGGASRGGNQVPPESTSGQSDRGRQSTMPHHFKIDNVWGAATGSGYDCRVTGESVSCTLVWESVMDSVDSYTGEFTGTLSGLTMTGTETRKEVAHATETSCASVLEDSGPFSAVFNPDGTATVRSGPTQRRTSVSGSCSGSWEQTLSESESHSSWSTLG